MTTMTESILSKDDVKYYTLNDPFLAKLYSDLRSNRTIEVPLEHLNEKKHRGHADCEIDEEDECKH